MKKKNRQESQSQSWTTGKLYGRSGRAMPWNPNGHEQGIDLPSRESDGRSAPNGRRWGLR